ncbi:MAG: T9SS type A sorting domain-containing protein [Bacteroidales bacterium]|nr:T9SS type A sorting domain-containing protein [Bacteroidales bacterium]
MTNPDLSYFSGITTLYAHPIIVPPDTDAVGYQPPTLRFLTSVSGFPWFSYSLTTDEEAVGYEVQYAPVGSDTWDTATNFAMQDARFKIFADFDATRYYRVRFRSQHRHGCPIHDTTYWSPWSDTVLFYTGPTAPDTTIGIAPVEGCPDGLFTLSPNPATGMVTVTVGSLTHSSALKGTSPNLGEELVLTLRDAAGHEVLRKEFSIVNCQFSIPLDLSGLAAGTYFVTLSTPASSATQRLVLK